MKKRAISKTSRCIIGFLWLFFSIGALSVLYTHQKTGQILETDLMALFPPIEQDVEIEIALNQVREKTDRKVVFLLGHEDLNVAIANAEKFSYLLKRESSVEHVNARLSEDDEKEWWRFYSQFSSHLLTPQLRKMLIAGDGKTWQQNVLAQVYSPFAAVSAEELRVDPMLLTRNFLMNLKQQHNQLSPENGWLVAKDESGKNYVFVAATISINPYSLVGAKSLVTRIDQIIVDLESSETGLECLRQGTLFYAAHGISQAKGEISTIGVGSIVGVCLLLLLMFRSAQPFFLGGLSIFSGLLFATAATVVVFGEIHIFTVVIGASLIGVSIDYSFHYLCEWLSEGDNWQPSEALHVIMPAITLGFLTSVLAYFVLLLTPFPGLRQLAVFSSAGLFTAFATVVSLYPLFLQKKSTRTLPMGSLLWEWINCFQRPKVRWVICLVLVGLALVTIPGLHINDDIRQLQAAPKELKRQGEVMASVIGHDVGQQLLLVRGSDENAVLQRLAEVGAWLDVAVQDGVLEGYRSPSAILPAVAQQEDDFHLTRKQLLNPWLPGLVKQIGLKPDLLQDVTNKQFRPMTVEGWLNSSVSEGWRTLWLGLIQKQYGAIVALNNVQNLQAIKSIEEDFGGVTYISRVDELSDLFRYYRVKVITLLILSYVGIFLLLCLRYGVVKSGLILLAPLLAGTSSLAALSLAGLPLNLFGVLGLVLVLGIGIDYTLFLAECRKGPMATLLAVALSACTTLLSFGLLFLSETTAIKTFGLVVLVGIFVAFILSPIAYNGRIKSKLE